MIALVLAGGGARGAYQVGVLRRVAELRPELPFSILAGSSVGSVNVSYLASRADTFASAVDSLQQLWEELTVDRIYRTDAISLLRIGLRWLRDLAGGGRVAGTRACSLLDTTPLAQLLRERIAFQNIQPLIERGVLHAVALTATCYTTAQTVSFVQSQAEIRPWMRSNRVAVLSRLGVEHVLAACAIPFIFPAVRIGAGHYGDGDIRLSNPFSLAVKLGADHIFAVSMRHAASAREVSAPVRCYPSPAQVAGVLLNSLFFDSLDDDAAQLARVNALLRRCDPAASVPDDSSSLRPVELFMIAPSRDLGRLAADYEHRFPPLVRWLLRGIGAGDTESADLESYLLFDRSYSRSLLELGYADATARSSEIERFLDHGAVEGEPSSAFKVLDRWR